MNITNGEYITNEGQHLFKHKAKRVTYNNSVSGLDATNTQDAIDKLVNRTTRTSSYTAVSGIEYPVYINLGSFINWDSRFVKIYKVVGAVRTEILFTNCTGQNTLDFTRIRFTNGDIDSANSYMINAIEFNSGVSVGDTIEIDYIETKDLEYKTNISPQGWDFVNNRIYEGVGVNSSNWQDINPLIPPEIWSKALFVNPDASSAELSGVGAYVSRANLPDYLKTNYLLNGVTTAEVRYLYPNVLIDQYAPIDFDYSAFDLRIEVFEVPKSQRRENGDKRSIPFGKFNYVGYYTHNLMGIKIFNGFGLNNNNIELKFRIRNMETNQISDWLPITMSIKRRFRPNSSISFIEDPKSAVWIKFKFI